MNIYKATCETDLSIVGAYPQVNFYSIKGHERPYDDVWYRRGHPSDEFDMTGVMAVKAKRTQVLSCKELSPGRGLLMENSVIELIKSYIPKSSVIHRFQVRDSDDELHAYRYLEVATTTEMLDRIDYERSSFQEYRLSESRSEVAISSWPDWKAKQEAENHKGTSVTIIPKELSLKQDFFDTYGVFTFPFLASIYFSERVAKIIEDNRTTGIMLTKATAILIK